jgi:hypothetical protein
MKLVKTTTHLDTVVLTDREFDLLHEPDSELTVIISKKVGDRWQTIERIEKVDLAYALTHIKRHGYGYYEGKKIVYIRPIKQPRKPRVKKQFCIGGHDTFVVGRNTSGACTECSKLHTNVSNQKKRLETALKKIARPIQLNGLNSDSPVE